MLEILKDNVLIAYQQLEQYQLDRYGRGVVSAIDRNRDMIFIKTAWQSVSVSLKDNIFITIYSPLSKPESHCYNAQTLLRVYQFYIPPLMSV